MLFLKIFERKVTLGFTLKKCLSIDYCDKCLNSKGVLNMLTRVVKCELSIIQVITILFVEIKVYFKESADLRIVLNKIIQVQEQIIINFKICLKKINSSPYRIAVIPLGMYLPIFQQYVSFDIPNLFARCTCTFGIWRPQAFQSC